jgi:hypothetical protein
VRFQDAKLLRSYKEATVCAWCGRGQQRGCIVAHHIITRGAGGSDIPENLIGLDAFCHLRMEVMPQEVQIAFQAWLLGIDAGHLTEFLWVVRRLDKSATLADVEQLRLEILGRAA